MRLFGRRKKPQNDVKLKTKFGSKLVYEKDTPILSKQGMVIYCQSVKVFCQEVNELFKKTDNNYKSRNYIIVYYSTISTADRLCYSYKRKTIDIHRTLNQVELEALIKYWPQHVINLKNIAAQSKDFELVIRNATSLRILEDEFSKLDLLKYAYSLTVFVQRIGVLSSTLAVKGHRFKKLSRVELKNISYKSLRYRHFVLKALKFSESLNELSVLKSRENLLFNVVESVRLNNIKLNTNWMKLYSLDFDKRVEICYEDIQIDSKAEQMMWWNHARPTDVNLKETKFNKKHITVRRSYSFLLAFQHFS